MLDLLLVDALPDDVEQQNNRVGAEADFKPIGDPLPSLRANETGYMVSEGDGIQKAIGNCRVRVYGRRVEEG